MPNKPTYEELEQRVRELEKSYFERKQAEEELRASEALFRNLFEHHATVKLIIDPDGGNIIDANNAAVKFYGWTREQLQQMRIQDINTLSPEQVKQEMEKARTDKRIHFEFRHRLADGSIRDVEVFSSKIEIKGKDLLHSVVHDITARKQAENALRESEKSFSQLFESAPVPMAYVSDVEGYRKTTWNEAWYRTFGYTREQAEGRSGNDIGLWVNPADRSRFLEMANRQNYVADFETLLRRRDGAVRNCLLFCRSIDKTGHRLLMAIYLDITDRKQAEAELRRSHQTFLTVLDGIDATVYVADMHSYEILFMNKQMIDAFGGDLTGRRCYEAFQGQSGPCSECTNDRLLDADGHPMGVCVYETKNPLTGKWYINHDRAIRWLDGQMVRLQIASDVTMLKEMEQERNRIGEQLIQAQKLESVGRLAGGVAHDFNNMLNVILGYAELAMDKVDPVDPLHSDLLEISAAAKRATRVTRQLLAFARKQTIAPEVLDLNVTIEGMLQMLRRLIGEDIELAWHHGTGLWPVKMDPSQLDQILANLCVNARDAITDVGKLIIETQKVTFDDAYCTDHPGFVQGDFVMLAVSDNGCGMDKETLAHIFEPFFTTKGVEKGTGLGLATVYGIVKQNNGFINVYSEPGLGTTLKIYFPRYEGMIDDIEKNKTASIPRGNDETLLVVEDDAAVLKLTEKILQDLGYTVLTAKTSGEALGLAERHADRIDLLVTDVVMPEMNGRDLANQIQTFCPNLKTLFMSGYTADIIAHHGVLDMGVHFIQKPFSNSHLADAVRNALDDEKRVKITGRILVIEDDQQMRTILKKWLEAAGGSVVEASNGKEGIARYRENPTDLIITDLIMPEKEGIEMIVELKKEFPAVKIIACSGAGEKKIEHYLRMAKMLGAARTFSKPIDKRELLKAVQKLLT